jgi:hypothetical protein
MNVKELIKELNKVKDKTLDINIRLTNDVIDSYTDTDSVEDIKNHLRETNFYPYLKEHIAEHSWSGFDIDGKPTVFGEVLIQGGE